jgi:hypothetical protein
MASGGNRKTTMAKRDRENKLRERRAHKKAKKEARKLEPQTPYGPAEMGASEHAVDGDAPPISDAMREQLAELVARAQDASPARAEDASPARVEDAPSARVEDAPPAHAEDAPAARA